jgi:hypothetical protein
VRGTRRHRAGRAKQHVAPPSPSAPGKNLPLKLWVDFVYDPEIRCLTPCDLLVTLAFRWCLSQILSAETESAFIKSSVISGGLPQRQRQDNVFVRPSMSFALINGDDAISNELGLQKSLPQPSNMHGLSLRESVGWQLTTTRERYNQNRQPSS